MKMLKLTKLNSLQTFQAIVCALTRLSHMHIKIRLMFLLLVLLLLFWSAVLLWFIIDRRIPLDSAEMDAIIKLLDQIDQIRNSQEYYDFLNFVHNDVGVVKATRDHGRENSIVVFFVYIGVIKLIWVRLYLSINEIFCYQLQISHSDRRRRPFKILLTTNILA